MEDLLATQQQLLGAVEQLYNNFKKDGSDRKTSDYIRRRLETLEQYWQEFQSNHRKLCGYGMTSHDYFVSKQFDQVRERYEHIKAVIQNYQVRESKPATPLLRPATPLGAMETPNKPAGAAPTPAKFTTSHEGMSNQDAGTTQQITFRAQGVNSKTDELLKKQASNFRAFQRKVTGLDLDRVTEKWELDDLLKTIQARWLVIDSLHLEIDSELEGKNQEYDNTFYHFEEIYEEIKKSINKKMWSVCHREKSTPQMELPSFNGNFQNWPSFKDLFTETIHNNSSLSSAQKMQFLKGKLRGEAERLVQHLQISSDNYVACWEILNNRYDNKKLIFTSHINTLMNIPVSQQPSCGHIKRIHDTSLESLNAIKNMGVDISTWDPLLVHILSQKLDFDTYNEYISSIKQPRDLPSLDEFLKFLQNKFTALETSRKKQENPQAKPSQNHAKPSYKFYNDSKKPTYFKQTFTSNNKFAQSASGQNLRSARFCPICKNDEHGLYYCSKFLEMPSYLKRKIISENKICKNCLKDHHGKSCNSDKRCRVCSENHNSILHEAFSNKKIMPTSNDASSSNNMNSEQPHGNTHALLQGHAPEILLATAVIKVQAHDGSYHNIRALLDQGSQTSLITDKAAQALGLPRRRCRGIVTGIGNKENNCKGVLTIKCQSYHEDFSFVTDAFIMVKLLNNLPSTTFPKPLWPILDEIPLADPNFNISSTVDLLLGADVYSSILLEGIFRAGPQLPIAQKTRLGWILSGNVERTLQCNVTLNNIDEIQQFWNIEDISEESPISSADQRVIEFYKNTTFRRPDGSYEVRLPLKSDVTQNLGTSKNKAIAQFKQLERKFSKQKQVAQEYKHFINEYLLLDHMKPADGNKTPSYYLPHHCVLREDSLTTKLRVVFNASAKTTSGYSLNDLMERGPNLQQDLQNLLIKWRQYRYGFTADIEKMFRQIWLNQHDQKYQRIIWRDSPLDVLQEFQLTTVTYGTKAAPFLAMMTLRQLADDEAQNYHDSSATQVIKSAFYMDDLVHGCHSIESARQLIHDLIHLLKSGGFNLRKWRSNNQDLLKLVDCNQENIEYDFKQVESQKTLGLSWNPNQDSFSFTSKMTKDEDSNKSHTKRSFLSDISKLFDPLGWLSPVSIKIKILFQQVWQLQLQWDDPLPQSIQKEWIKIKSDIININQFYLPRWLGTVENGVVELHGFSDASIKAYACVVYCKVTTRDLASVIMVAGKARLVPISKTYTLPRLELCGALLLTKLLEKIKNCLEGYQINIYCWADSTAVLGWINGAPERWNPFVSNRIKQITQVAPPGCWRYVKSEENPADCASRGLTASQLRDHKLWWSGPAWLPTWDASKQEKNQEKIITYQEVRKCKQVAIVVNQEKELNIIRKLLYNYSSLSKITRILAWMYRFITRKQERKSYLTLSEINQARIKIVMQTQQEYFSQEIEALKRGCAIAPKSKICMLNPILDQDHVLRVGGRLKHAHIILDMKHPCIIPKYSRLSELIIDQCHELTYHGGAKLTLAFMRQKYWLVGGIKATKKRIHECVKCRKHNPSRHYQIMGDLPAARVNPSRPFYHSGVDYTGHVMVKSSRGRGIKASKGYVAVFVCMVTKAVHLELVSDLTTSAFLAALRRMSARRGVPRHMYSDQGTTFIGANKVLQQEYEQIMSTFNSEFVADVTNMGIEWHFNAPSWPSAGGLWEASVKSLKYHMKRVIGEQRLTFEEYSTLLSQLEACLNQRPLCQLTEDPDDLNCLTPSHFLTSGPMLTFFDTETDLRTRWYLTQKIFGDIWKRWQSEYLTQLSARSKWMQSQPNIKINDVVIIQDTNLPAGKWPLGRVIELHPGSDGYVRVVTLKTKNGVLKRPIVKLSILPVHQENNDHQRLSQTDDHGIKKACHVSQLRKRTTFSFSKFAFTFIMFFMTLIASSKGSYNITPLQNNQSLYFDKVTDMYVIRDEWRLVVYYDMSPYWEGSQALNKSIEYLQNICDTIKSRSHCSEIMFQLRYGNEQLIHYNSMLMSNQKLRTRRGLVNGIGSIARSLFGILDNDFAEKYEQDIQLIKKNQEHLAILWKNQTSVVEAEFNILKRTEIMMDKQHKLINQRLHNIESTLKNLQSVNTEDAVINDFTLSAVIANNILTHLKEMQTTLLDTLTNIYNGQLSLHLLSPEQLRHELNIISGRVSKDLIIPFDNIELPMIYHLLKIKSRMSENYLIFEIKVPLVHRDSYEVYKVIPIPQFRNDRTMVSIKPVSSYLAYNMKKDALLPMTESDLKSCQQQNQGAILCMTRSPVYRIKDDESLCERSQVTTKCNVEQVQCRENWLELHELNTYFYFCCPLCQPKLICEDQVIPIELSNAGLITTGEGCIIKFKDFTVFTHKQGMSNLQIKAEFKVPKLSPINHLINVPIPVTNVTKEEGSQHLKSLVQIQRQIEEMQQTVPLYDNINTHDIHHYTMLYVILGIMALVATLWVVKSIKSKYSSTTGSATAAARETAVPRLQTSGPRRETETNSVGVSASDQCGVSGDKCSAGDQCGFRVARNQCRPVKSMSRSAADKLDKCTSPTYRTVYVVGDESVRYNSL